MAGSSIFDYVHHQDHSELAQHLGLTVPQASSSEVPSPGSCDEDSQPSQRGGSPSPQENRGHVMRLDPKLGCHRSFCLRMKSTLTKRGVHVKSSGYRVVHVLGQLRPQLPMGLAGGGKGGGAGGGGTPAMGLVAMAVALPPPTITELKLEHDTFITRMTPDFTLSYCEPLIAEHMDLSAEDVTNRSLYDLCHAGDLVHLRETHLYVLEKGQAMTDYYRMLTRSGGYVWVQTCVTTLLNGKNADDQNILAINYVLSGVENAHCTLNLWQLCGSDNPAPTSSAFCAHAQNDHGHENEDSHVSSKSHSSSNEHGAEGDHLHKHTGARSPSPHSSHRLHPDQDTDVLSDDSGDLNSACGAYVEKNEAGVSQDCKNSRRKMERPRKRKREEMEQGEGEASPGSPRSGSSGAEKKSSSNSMDASSGRPLSRDDASNAVSSPEDLSLRSTSSAEAPPKLSSSQPSLTPPGPLASDRDTPGSGPWQGSGGSGNTVTPSTVKELEAVMNRHLPFLESSPLHPEASPPARMHGGAPRANGSSSAGGFSNTFPAHAAKKSTIQWVGSHSAAAAAAPSTADAMAASSFLRSLYENRESVIRSCSSAAVTSTAASSNINTSGSNDNVSVMSEGGGPRGGPLYGDMGGTMLTPPGTDAYKDHPPPFSIPSIVISSAGSHLPPPPSSSSSSSSSKPLSVYGGHMGRGYPTGALSLSLPCGGAGLGDAYGMTPPSSVSPQDRLASPFAAAAAALAYNDGSCGINRPSSIHPSSSSAVSSSSSLVNKDGGLGFHGGGGHTSDYASAKAAYYAMSALSGAHPGHAGYADVNHNTTAAYDQCARPVIPWY